MNEGILESWLIHLAALARPAPGLDPEAVERLAGDWSALAAELRRDGPMRWSDEQVAWAARALRARAAAARLPVHRVDHPPDEYPAPVVGLLSQIVDAAAARSAAPFLDLAAAAGSGRELWDTECESWIALPTTPELPRGRYIALRISGESMAPLLRSGDIVLVQLGPRLSRNAVIVAQRPEDGCVVKAVGAIGRRSIELRSLNPDFPPITVPRSEQVVVGTVVMRWRAAGAPPATG